MQSICHLFLQEWNRTFIKWLQWKKTHDSVVTHDDQYDVLSGLGSKNLLTGFEKTWTNCVSFDRKYLFENTETSQPLWWNDKSELLENWSRQAGRTGNILSSRRTLAVETDKNLYFSLRHPAKSYPLRRWYRLRSQILSENSKPTWKIFLDTVFISSKRVITPKALPRSTILISIHQYDMVFASALPYR